MNITVNLREIYLMIKYIPFAFHAVSLQNFFLVYAFAPSPLYYAKNYQLLVRYNCNYYTCSNNSKK